VWTTAVIGDDVPPLPSHLLGAMALNRGMAEDIPMGGVWLSNADYEKLYTS